MECCAVCVNCGDTIEPGNQARVICNRRAGVYFVCAGCEEAANRRGLRLDRKIRRAMQSSNQTPIVELLLNDWVADVERVVALVPPLMILTREVLT